MTGFLFEDVDCVDDLRTCAECGEVFDQFGGDKGPWLMIEGKAAQDHCIPCWKVVSDQRDAIEVSE